MRFVGTAILAGVAPIVLTACSASYVQQDAMAVSQPITPTVAPTPGDMQTAASSRRARFVAGLSFALPAGASASYPQGIDSAILRISGDGFDITADDYGSWSGSGTRMVGGRAARMTERQAPSCRERVWEIELPTTNPNLLSCGPSARPGQCHPSPARVTINSVCTGGTACHAVDAIIDSARFAPGPWEPLPRPDANAAASAPLCQIPAAQETHSATAAPVPTTAVTLDARWAIVEFDGQAPVAAGPAFHDRVPSLTFTPTGYGGTAGCNALGGIGTQVGARYYTMPGPQTQMGCPTGLAEQETLLDQVMRGAPTIVSEAPGRVTLVSGSHRLMLMHSDSGDAAASPPAPVLNGLAFQIVSIDGAFLTPRNQQESRPLSFAADTWRAVPECAVLSGSWRQRGWQLETKVVPPARDRCPSQSSRLDEAVQAIFAAEPRFSVGPNGEFLLAGGGHWLTAARDRNGARRSDTKRQRHPLRQVESDHH